MTDQTAVLDDALEQVIEAARAHLSAVKAADGAIDDEQVWLSYVALNNSSFAYDQLLLDTYGEVTPWDTEEIDTSGASKLVTDPDLSLGGRDDDPHPELISVRQRRDYRVPSVTALLAAAGQAARRVALDDEPVVLPQTVGEAVLELVRDGDGALGGLDIPELEPLAGVVTVCEGGEPLDTAELPEDSTQLFATGVDERLLARLDEQPYPDDDADSGESLDGDPPLR